MRQSARVELGGAGRVVPVKIRLDGNEEISANIDNISATGLAVATPGALTPGERVGCEVEIPIISSDASFVGEVRWSEPSAGDSFRAGLRLLDLDATAKLGWHQLLASSIEATEALEFVDPSIAVVDEKTGTIVESKRASQFFLRDKYGKVSAWTLEAGSDIRTIIGDWSLSGLRIDREIPEIAATTRIAELWEILCRAGGVALLVGAKGELRGVTTLNMVGPIWWQYQISTHEIQKRDLEWQRSILSHELRGPIGAIKSTIALLNENILSPDEFVAEGLGKEIEHRCEVATEELEAVLEMAKRNQKSDENACLVAEAIKLIEEAGVKAREKGIAIELQTSEVEAKVKTGVVALDQILRNLISNAVKYSYGGGSVVVTIFRDRQGRPVLEVKDRGVGLDTDRIEHLGKKGVTLNRKPTAGEKQTGFGLYWVKLLTEEAGGALSFGNNADAGAYFRVVFPQV